MVYEHLTIMPMVNTCGFTNRHTFFHKKSPHVSMQQYNLNISVIYGKSISLIIIS